VSVPKHYSNSSLFQASRARAGQYSNWGEAPMSLSESKQNSCPLCTPLILSFIERKNVMKKNKKIQKIRIFEVNESLRMLINRQALSRSNKSS
jgi:hypothetical protein